IVLDPFMGSGSTIGAANAVGYRSLGIEINPDYFDEAERSIPRLSALAVDMVNGVNGSES
ncbi:MAG: DNA methyltransferase, partial [Pseudomonadota bacterium]